jgi:hypothetical protein
MSNPPPTGIPDDKYRLPTDAALGGADAVPDTHYVPHPEPERPKGDAHAHPPAREAPNATLAIVVFLAVAAVLVYLLGFGR